jgi:hypothetical protein
MLKLIGWRTAENIGCTTFTHIYEGGGRRAATRRLEGRWRWTAAHGADAGLRSDLDGREQMEILRKKKVWIVHG